MLTSGIKRIVEQVVNPKVHREFKPKVDLVSIYIYILFKFLTTCILYNPLELFALFFYRPFASF